MSLPRLLASCLVVFHLAAYCVDAIPSPSDLGVERFAASLGRDPISRAVAPALDRVVLWLIPIHHRLSAAANPLRGIAGVYHRVGVRQRWDMFSRPPVYDQYVRIGYHFSTSAGPRQVRELVFPIGRADRIRFAHDYEDKAVMTAFETFFGTSGETGSARSPVPLLPLLRHYRTRYERGHPENGQAARTELWYGRAPIPPPGERRAARLAEPRRTVLDGYYRGGAAVDGYSQSLRVGSQEQEADITWVLAAVDESGMP